MERGGLTKDQDQIPLELIVVYFEICILDAKHQRLLQQSTVRLVKHHKLDQLHLLQQEQMHGLALLVFCNLVLELRALILADKEETLIYGMVRITPIVEKPPRGTQLLG